MTVRLLQLAHGADWDTLARRIVAAQKEGRSILLVSAESPGQLLFDQLGRRGVDDRRLFVVDSLGDQGAGGRPRGPDHFMPVSSPSQLELMLLRAKKFLVPKAEGPLLVILHTLDAFAQHNPPGALVQAGSDWFSTKRPDTLVDLAVVDAARLHPMVLEFLRKNAQ